MIKINVIPERENLSDENILRILKDVCECRSSEKVSELRRLIKLLSEEK